MNGISQIYKKLFKKSKILHRTIKFYCDKTSTRDKLIENNQKICKKNLLENEMINYGQVTYWTHPHLFDKNTTSEQVTPGISKEEFENRRHNYVKYLSNYQNYYFKNSKGDCGYLAQNANFISIIPSNMVSYMAPDVPYTFKQNSDFLYLTGFKEPNSLIVLSRTDSDNGSFKAALFVRDKDPKKEIWEGAFSGPNNINKICGIENSYSLNEFETYLLSLLKESKNKKITLWRYPTEELLKNEANANCYNAKIEFILNNFYENNKEKLILMNKLDNSESILNTSRYFVQFSRIVKSKSEIDIMRKACEIASEAFKKTITVSHPYVNEHLLYAKFDYECRLRGADHLAYIPVIAGGARATILHYIRNDQLIKNKRLVLMDAGCLYRDYVSDITRTWSINGTYNSAQRELYEACLNVQKYCLEHCRSGMNLNNLYKEMIKKLAIELMHLGILNENDFDKNSKYLNYNVHKKISKYCPHDVGHYLGLDVHDCPEISKSIEFEPGTVITVEPGIYVHPNDENAPERFRGLGVRIEDNVAITNDGHDVLSKDSPKEIQEVEDLFN